MEVYVSLDNKSYNSKPTDGIGSMKHRVSSLWQKIELEELAVMNGSKGYSIVPAHMEGGLKAENCIAMQLFVLDFDGGCTFTEIKDRCNSMELDIAYAYHTFSSSPVKEKFRVVFVCEELVTDRFVISAVLHMLHKIFPECDSSCKNLDRMFYGGKELIYINKDACLNLVHLFFSLMDSLNTGKHFSENLKRFAKDNHILVEDGHICMGCYKDIESIYGGNMDPAGIHITGGSTKSPFFIVEDDLHQTDTRRKEDNPAKRRLAIKNNNTGCKLYNDFENGEKLEHDAEFAIVTNLLGINGGVKHFLEKIEDTSSSASLERWKKNIKFIKGYHPKRCSEDFCPYFDTCENKGTIINALEINRRVYREKEQYVSIREAEGQLYENLEHAFSKGKTGIHLIKAQTGLGKTEAYISLIKANPKNRFLIAAPTNELKKEIKERLKNRGMPDKDIFMTPSISNNNFIPIELRKEIEKAHMRGIHNKTKETVKHHLEKIQKNPDRMYALEEEYGQILNGLDKVDARIIVTTHAYLLNLAERQLKDHTVIIDEDILYTQVFKRIYSVSVSCLEDLKEKMPHGFFGETASELIRSEEGVCNMISGSQNTEPLSESQMDELGYYPDDNINDLMRARVYVKVKDKSGDEKIKYFCPAFLPPVKYIILSATFNYGIYRMYFKGKAEIFAYPEKKAGYKGKLVQYTYHSMGRTDLAGKEQAFSIAREQAGSINCPVITFKKYEDIYGKEYLNASGMHFGNCIGMNSLSGKDLIIIGTPYGLDETYKLIACFLGADVNSKEDRRPKFQRADYKGCNFLITTYSDKILQMVQLYALESELEQAVGRARLLRNDCTVYVYSAFPCEQAELQMNDYLVETDENL